MKNGFIRMNGIITKTSDIKPKEEDRYIPTRSFFKSLKGDLSPNPVRKTYFKYHI